jgi:serine/threonine protein phosphatase PrpC
MVTDDVIAAVLERELDPEAGATKLVALANEAGGSDNVTF